MPPYGYFPQPYVQVPWYPQAQVPLPTPGSAPPTLNPAHPTLSPALPVPKKQVKASDCPKIATWLNYCDNHPDRCGEAFTLYAPKFEEEGWRHIHQLTGDCISVEKLSDWLGIGKGTADLLIRYVEEDMELIRAGTFTMELADEAAIERAYD